MKVNVNVVARLTLDIAENTGVELGDLVNDAINEMDYSFVSNTEDATIVDSEIIDNGQVVEA